MALDVIADKLEAYRSGRAVLRTATQRVVIQPHARVLCPIAMSGEDTTIHIIAYGHVNANPSFLSVPDPRNRDAQYRLFARMGGYLDRYFTACWRANTYPQIWVSTGSVAGHLDVIADRLRFSGYEVMAKRFGELLYYFTERYPIDGQQSLHDAASVLSRHWAIPQDEAENQHLLTVLTAISPPLGTNLMAAIARAEEIPMAANTNPEFDNIVLAPLVGDYNRARREGASLAVLELRAKLIETELKTVAGPIYRATRRAIELLRAQSLPALPALDEMERREKDIFSRYMNYLDSGGRLPRTDRPKAAAFGLTTREDAAQNLRAALVEGDRVERAKARLRGHVLTGEVAGGRRLRISPYRSRYIFRLRSRQAALPIRLGDELYWCDDPRLRVLVARIKRVGGQTHVTLELLGGMKAVGLPAVGTSMDFTHCVADWNRLWQSRDKLKRRLAVTPFTHDSTPLSGGSTASASPADPLAEVEALR